MFSHSLATEEHVLAMVSILTADIQELDVDRRFKYPYIAAEILSNPSTEFQDLLHKEPVLDALFQWLERPDPIEAARLATAKSVFSCLFLDTPLRVCSFLLESSSFFAYSFSFLTDGSNKVHSRNSKPVSRNMHFLKY
jgi:hypothetical protein